MISESFSGKGFLVRIICTDAGKHLLCCISDHVSLLCCIIPVKDIFLTRQAEDIGLNLFYERRETEISGLIEYLCAGISHVQSNDVILPFRDSC